MSNKSKNNTNTEMIASHIWDQNETNSSSDMQHLFSAPFSNARAQTVQHCISGIMKMKGVVCKDDRTVAMREKLKRKIEMRKKQREGSN